MRRVLLDAWTMKGPLVKRILADGCAVIGREPGHGGHRSVPEIRTPQRGRPPTYGPTLTWEVVTNRYARQEVSIQTEIRTALPVLIPSPPRYGALVPGGLVSLVPLPEDYDSWTTWCLVLSTDPEIAPERIIRVYALRWWVEPLFVDSSTCAVWRKAGNRPDRPCRSSFLVILSHGLRSSCSVLWSGGRQVFPPSQGAGLLD